MSSQPKSSFWLAVWAVIFGLVGLAGCEAGLLGVREEAELARDICLAVAAGLSFPMPW